VCAEREVDKPGTETALLLRSYGGGDNICPVWQAGCMTAAAPGVFQPWETASEDGTEIVDGGCVHNNPVDIAIKEADREWPGRKIGCVVSIGCGQGNGEFQPDQVAQHLRDYHRQCMPTTHAPHVDLLDELNLGRSNPDGGIATGNIRKGLEEQLRGCEYRRINPQICTTNIRTTSYGRIRQSWSESMGIAQVCSDTKVAEMYDYSCSCTMPPCHHHEEGVSDIHRSVKQYLISPDGQTCMGAVCKYLYSQTTAGDDAAVELAPTPASAAASAASMQVDQSIELSPAATTLRGTSSVESQLSIRVVAFEQQPSYVVYTLETCPHAQGVAIQCKHRWSEVEVFHTQISTWEISNFSTQSSEWMHSHSSSPTDAGSAHQSAIPKVHVSIEGNELIDDVMYYCVGIERDPPDQRRVPQTKRRYSEFEKLNTQLSCHCDRVQRLAFPQKQMISVASLRGSFRKQGSPEVQERSIQLDDWLNEVLEICSTGCPPVLGRSMLGMIEEWFLSASAADKRVLRYKPRLVQYHRQSNAPEKLQQKQQQLDTYFLDFCVWADRVRIDHGIDLLQDPSSEERSKLKDLQARAHSSSSGGGSPGRMLTAELKELQELLDIKACIGEFLRLPTRRPHPQSRYSTAMFFCVTKPARVTETKDASSATIEWLQVGHVVECLITEQHPELGVSLISVPTTSQTSKLRTGWVALPLDGSREPLVRIKGGAHRHGTKHSNCMCRGTDEIATAKKRAVGDGGDDGSDGGNSASPSSGVDHGDGFMSSQRVRSV
jgi:hypothetical protein